MYLTLKFILQSNARKLNSYSRTLISVMWSKLLDVREDEPKYSEKEKKFSMSGAKFGNNNMSLYLLV